MKRKHLLLTIGLITMCTVFPSSSAYGAETTLSGLSESVAETSAETEESDTISEEIQSETSTEILTETTTDLPKSSTPETDESAPTNPETTHEIPKLPESEILDEESPKHPDTEETNEEKVKEDKQDKPSVPIYEGKWIKDQSGWWWQNPDGSYPVSQWKQIKGIWYYFSPSGYMTTGWQQIHGNWYYLNSSGAMQTGWQYIHRNWYFMNSSGAMTTGWQLVDNSWYYLSASGAMKTGWLQSGSSWYYLSPSGAMQTGWIHTGNHCYYLTESGSMVNSGWKEIDKKWYYFYGNGSMASNTWIGNYYVNNSGVWEQEKQTLQYVWPCPGYSTVTSDFGYRGASTSGASTYHKGIDIGAPYGAQIVSICNGTVLSYGYNSSMGNYVKIQHANNMVSVYMHMSRIANISTGQNISAGSVIGYVGSTGISTGAHLHLGVLKNNSYVSPWNYLKRP